MSIACTTSLSITIDPTSTNCEITQVCLDSAIVDWILAHEAHYGNPVADFQNILQVLGPLAFDYFGDTYYSCRWYRQWGSDYVTGDSILGDAASLVGLDLPYEPPMTKLYFMLQTVGSHVWVYYIKDSYDSPYGVYTRWPTFICDWGSETLPETVTISACEDYPIGDPDINVILGDPDQNIGFGTPA